MSRSFTSSDPTEVAKFCARPLSSQLTTFTASEVTALMEAADMANATIAAKDASLQSMAAANDDLRNELAAARAKAATAEANEQRWVALLKQREAQLETILAIASGRGR